MFKQMLTRSANDAERVKALRTAELITEMAESEGWKAFSELAETLVKTYTPDVNSFTPDQATAIASQMAFVSGIKRCVGLIDQQREILQTLKKPESN